VPLIERASLDELFVEPGISASTSEYISNLLEVGRQKSRDEIHYERLAEIELSLVEYWDVFFGVVDVIRQLFVIVQGFGMPVNLARSLADVGLILSALANAGEFESQLEIRPFDAHSRPAARTHWNIL
jgi:hypothetical protein